MNKSCCVCLYKEQQLTETATHPLQFSSSFLQLSPTPFPRQWKPCGQGSLAGYNPWGPQSDMPEWLKQQQLLPERSCIPWTVFHVSHAVAPVLRLTLLNFALCSLLFPLNSKHKWIKLKKIQQVSFWTLRTLHSFPSNFISLIEMWLYGHFC